METKPYILLFPIELDREIVESINGNTYSEEEVTNLIIKHRRFVGDILKFDLHEFSMAVNDQEIDVLTESWIAYVNITQ